MLKDALISAALTLSDMKKQVDELNVYPVPDGDTGTNMSMTITAAARAVENLDTDNISTIKTSGYGYNDESYMYRSILVAIRL